MKKHFMKLLWILLLGEAIYLAYKLGVNICGTYDKEVLTIITKMGVYTFVAGMAFVAFVYEFLTSATSKSLNAYKRELEKESIDKTESSSKIKVLESKIEVLEKALDEALKK
ncbi:hypothetical protein J6O48_01510 [bacterium]|nr:hypothetical protein [bacterium]